MVVCSELPNNPGGPITNSAEVIAAGVILTNKLPTPLVWLEHWPKESTRMATRYEKRAVNYRAMVVIAALVIWLTA